MLKREINVYTFLKNFIVLFGRKKDFLVYEEGEVEANLK